MYTTVDQVGGKAESFQPPFAVRNPVVSGCQFPYPVATVPLTAGGAHSSDSNSALSKHVRGSAPLVVCTVNSTCQSQL